MLSPSDMHVHVVHADGERCFSRGVLCIEPCELCRVLLRWSVGSDAQYLRLSESVSELSNCPAELCLAYDIAGGVVCDCASRYVVFLS